MATRKHGARVRKAALSHEGAYEVPHMERAAFRTKRRIFATLAADEASANLFFSPEQQELFTSARPDAFAPVPGGWGRMGFTTVTLAHVDDATLRDALAAAHGNAAAPAKKKARATKKKTAAASSFAAVVQHDHDTHYVLVPFEPAERWPNHPLVKIPRPADPRGGKGWMVEGTVAGVPFAGHVGKRYGRVYVILDDVVRKAAHVRAGDEIELSLRPLS